MRAAMTAARRRTLVLGVVLLVVGVVWGLFPRSYRDSRSDVPCGSAWIPDYAKAEEVDALRLEGGLPGRDLIRRCEELHDTGLLVSLTLTGVGGVVTLGTVATGARRSRRDDPFRPN